MTDTTDYSTFPLTRLVIKLANVRCYRLCCGRKGEVSTINCGKPVRECSDTTKQTCSGEHDNTEYYYFVCPLVKMSICDLDNGPQ